MSDIKTLDRQYVAGTYRRFDLELVKGQGSLVWDEAGKQYIDMGTGIGVTAFGFADQEWQRAVTQQLSTLQHTSNLYYTSPCARLAQHLCQRTGMKKVFFSNSGAEANECAIKVARKYAEDLGQKDPCIVTLQNSFHGRTVTTLAATGQEVFHKSFSPLTPGFVHTPANDVQALEQTVAAHKPVAILFECVQGEGGVIPLTQEFCDCLTRLQQQQGVLLLADEVQTGNGRTGSLYAYQQLGLNPDVVSTAKGLGGGLPIGATLLGQRVENTLGFGDHGSTFGGNPVCAAGALSILERIDQAMLTQIREKSQLIRKELEGAKGIVSVTGMGLMVGIETVRPVAEVLKECMEQGVLCLSAKTKLRLLPALNIPTSLLQEALNVIKSVCARTSED